MKLMSSILEKKTKSMSAEKSVLCDYIQTQFGPRLLNEPVLSTEHSCSSCGTKKHYTPHLDPKTSDKRVWLCGNAQCDVYKLKIDRGATLALPDHKRAVEWPLFCEINGIGDIHHGVKFQNIEQSPGKIDFLLKFAKKPFGIVFMQGGPGAGKTYAAMAVAELFTRKSNSCIFLTQKQMLKNWLDTFKSDQTSTFLDRVSRVSLLIVDDFGTGEISAGFMSFFMDIINSRMQWTDRGTIITTNLDNEKFENVCGDALHDRIKTGQKLLFSEQSRRKPMIL